MNPTLEERLRVYANTLDAASVSRTAKTTKVHDTPVANLDNSEGRVRHLRKRSLVAAVAVVAVVFAAATTLVVVRSDHATTQARPTPSTVPLSSHGLRVLFDRTAPNGIRIVARVGLVPAAEAAECPIVPVPHRQPSSPFCTNAKAQGVEFQYTVDGHTYRATVLDRDVPHTAGPNLVPMITLALIRQVRPNGTTVFVSGKLSPYLVVLHAADLAKVRVNPSRTASTGRDAMTPVSGWVAFAARGSFSANPLDRTVEGLDAAGRVVTTAYPWRCC
jgi:hypothetical protein